MSATAIGMRSRPKFCFPRKLAAQSPMGADHVVCISRHLRDLFPHSALLHGRHLAQERCRGRAHEDQSMDHRRWGDARSIPPAADADRFSDLFQEHGDRDGVRGGDHDGGQRARCLLTRPHEVLGLEHPGNRHFSDLLGSRHAVVHSALSDRQGARAAQLLLEHGAGLSDADGAVLHLDHDRLFPVDPQRA